MRTTQEWQELWLAALESGKFRQGKRRLAVRANKNIKYCCLGVACEIYSREEPVSISYADDRVGDWRVVSKRYCGNPSCMPANIMEVFGISGDGHGKLADMNDKGNMTFKEIAATIRARPEWFFLKSIDEQ